MKQSTLKKWLLPPQFEDPDQARIASVLYPILLTLAVAAIVLMLSALHPAVAPNPYPVILTDLAILLLVVPTIWMVRNGHIERAGMLFPATLWLFVTFASIFYGGITGPVVGIYCSVALIAGFLWGGRGIVGFTAISGIAALAITVATYAELLPEPLSHVTPASAWITLMVALGLSSMVVSLSTRSTARAMSEARRNERAHRESEERYRVLVDQNPDALFVHGDGRLLFANRAFAEMLRAENAEILVGRSILETLQPNATLEQRRRTEANLSETAERHLVQDEWIRANGETFPVELSTRSMQFEGRPAIQVLARDVSERLHLEDELRQAQKMEAIGRLAGGIAHDFNNMLTAISGHNRFVMQTLSDGSEELQDAREIERAAGRAAELTQKLLAFSRRQVLQPVVMDLNAAIRETETMLRRLIGENIELITHLDPQIGHVRADPVQIEQVILNLAVNARDSMPRGGRIRVTTRNIEVDRSDDLPAGEYVELWFQDEGTGMDEETQAQAFDPFFTTKHRANGTGLGLSTVYGIVKQSGGAIILESEPEQGSIFRIQLPRCDESLPDRPVRSTPIEPGSGTILVAEDEDPVRRLVVRFLSEAGYEVLSASNGAEALQLAKRHPHPIDLLLTDVIMPEMGGPELAEHLKDSHPESRVLYMSGYTGEHLGRQGVVADHASCVAKPFLADDLVQQVRVTLNQAPRT